QKLLASLPACVESSRHLSPPKRPIGKQSAIFTRKRHALRDALVDDAIADLSETIHVRFAGTKVAALDRVVKQSVNAVAIVLVILCRVEPTLGGNRMGSARRILKAKTFHVIPQLTQSCRRRSTGKTASYNNDLEFSPVVWANQTGMIKMVSPFLSKWTGRNLGVEPSNHSCWAGLTHPSKMAMGIDI